MASSQSQTNGVSAASAGTSQTVPNTQATTSSQPPASTQPTQASQQSQQQPASQQAPTTASDPRPRDARLIELLLTSQGVTSYEQRVPLLLLDFAYRHTSSILSDALHLAGDPYVTQAGSKPSASSGATATAPGEAPITANAVKLAIGARLSYQFRGGSAGGGISKEYMQELARDRNKVALPKIVPNEWGVRLPSERFVLTGTSWGLKDLWEGDEDDDDEDMDDDEGRQQQAGRDAMEGVQGPDPEEVGGDGVEGGTVEDVFGDDVDEEMAEE
ncbi:transcription initiation factor TFIID subunit [Purpureocillium lavendulum]|uniref:Transcription initiation factor TFIID subunit n=1 Tax=Purpureocillium lavendulum TaxID=1247861 RepID=A0AB34FY25_9HYPO|nr:transcription initiation factor TFIID subunit [Purpureocillium lavendulum]